MKHGKRRIVPGLVILCAGLIAHFIGGALQSIIVPLSFLGAGAWLALSIRIVRPSSSPGFPAESTSVPHTLLQSVGQEVSREVAHVNVSVLGAQYRKEQWIAMEKIVDDLLDCYIQVLRSRLDGHTIAIFFPTTDGGYRIRRCDSKSEYINHEAVIYPGVGVIGGFLKDGLKQLNLHEIVTDSMTLYYYKKDAGIRSLMASPIMAEGVERGTIIVDSTEIKHFSDEDHNYLSNVAQLVGSTVYYAYMSTEHRLEHKRIVSMSSIEKDFFQNLTIDAILDRMVEIIPFAISCDRLTISLRGPEKNLAVVRRAWGAGEDAEAKAEAEEFKGKCFSLEDKTLISLVYAKNMSLYRDFVEDHYETRYYEGEPRSEGLASFLAFPIGVDMCKGAFFLESARKKAF